MDIYKGMSCEKRESVELTEAAREAQWCYPSFVRELFHGGLPLDLIYPFPRQSREDKEIGTRYLEKLRGLLTNCLRPDEVDKTGEVPEEVMRRLADLGAFSMKIAPEYDGLGLSQVNYNRAIHLVASYCNSTAVLLSAHQSIGVPYPLTLFGTEEQKKKYLPRFRKGAISGFALTEPGAGSDPRTMKTTATPSQDGQYYFINGEKLWCSNGNIADVLLVMCLTPPKAENGRQKKQITAFIVETDTPGFERALRCDFMGLKGVQLGLLKFNNVKVPRENMLLGEGQGLRLALTTLNTGRLTVPAAMTGAAKWCLSVVRRWAKERKQWGHPIGEHQMVASKLANIAANTLAMEAVTWLTSHMADAKKLDIRLEAAMAKLFSTEAGWGIIDDTFQIRGGRGFETGPSQKVRGEQGFAVERLFRDTRVNRVIEGTSQIMRLFIAREAMDPHLRRIQEIFNPRAPVGARIKSALRSGFYYVRWSARLFLPSLSLKGGRAWPKPLRRHLRFIQAAAKRLARVLFFKMLIHQQNLEAQQNILSRLVDLGTDLFVMAGVCSYAASKTKEDEAGQADSAAVLADLFCVQARTRIARNFEDLRRNDDKKLDRAAKDILAGKYQWLENEIIVG